MKTPRPQSAEALPTLLEVLREHEVGSQHVLAGDSVREVSCLGSEFLTPALKLGLNVRMDATERCDSGRRHGVNLTPCWFGRAHVLEYSTRPVLVRLINRVALGELHIEYWVQLDAVRCDAPLAMNV